MLRQIMLLLSILLFYSGCNGSTEMMYDIANDSNYAKCRKNPNQSERRECEETYSHTYQEFKKSQEQYK